jgi:hypothetical protein
MEVSKFSIDGLSELMSALNDLPNNVQNNILNSTIVKAENKFIVATLRSALTYSSSIKDTIRVVKDRRNKNSYYGGISSGKRTVQGRPPAGVLGRFIDGGTVERHYITKKGNIHRTGAVKARNEVGSVIDGQIQPIVNWLNNDLGDEIDKNLLRRLKRVNKKLSNS